MVYSLDNQEKAANLLSALSQKAWEDSAFKNQLVVNPVETIEQYIGKKIPGLYDKKVIVDDQTDSSVIYLNIPQRLDLNNLELTEEDLELIAGGITPTLAYAGGFLLVTAVGAAVKYFCD